MQLVAVDVTSFWTKFANDTIQLTGIEGKSITNENEKTEISDAIWGMPYSAIAGRIFWLSDILNARAGKMPNTI